MFSINKVQKQRKLNYVDRTQELFMGLEFD